MNGVGAVVLGFLRNNWLLLLILGAVAVAFVALRTPASDVASIEELDALLTGGQPAVVEFYSNT